MHKISIQRWGLVSLTILSLILGSCKSTIPYTNTIKSKYNLGEEELKKMQFFISSNVTLQRGEKADDSQELDKDGKLIVSSSSSVDEIFIPAGTPGVCVKVLAENRLAISFDKDDDKYLVFGDPNNRGRYHLMGAEWKNGRGKIKYGGKVYYVMPGGAGAYVKFELKKVKDYERNQTTVRGRKI